MPAGHSRVLQSDRLQLIPVRPSRAPPPLLLESHHERLRSRLSCRRVPRTEACSGRMPGTVGLLMDYGEFELSRVCRIDSADSVISNLPSSDCTSRSKNRATISQASTQRGHQKMLGPLASAQASVAQLCDRRGRGGEAQAGEGSPQRGREEPCVARSGRGACPVGGPPHGGRGQGGESDSL